ncbi:transcription factor MYB124 [Coffea eugenioides]|uniref:Transcription factor MYB124 n=1 Tax=Coffea arabica TaxID=13443 RepID=A0A6P6V0F1_COFAR|nr:transcription factor MYB124 [Coffea eugenioides]
MQSVKRRPSSNTGATDAIATSQQQQQQQPKQKERHIVSWSQEEDDILREQIRIHGTENWAIIASKFKDKTTRQCRRRWFTYLNSDFKKGGWSPEEDLLLCEAQKIFGNRWTEIAKVVSGRTDNAVKNRFSTLCKKRAKREALAKENNTSYINLNNKRVIFPSGLSTNGISEAAGPLKKMRRAHIPDPTESCNREEELVGECATSSQLLRPPFAVLAQNIHKSGSNLSTQQHGNDVKEAPTDASNNKIQGTFLKKDDPKVLALMQQAELLSSLAAKVNVDSTDQSLENAWKVLQDFLNQNKESDEFCFRISDMDVQLDILKDLVEDLQGSFEGNQASWRQPDLYEESSGSSEYSTGSTLPSHLPLDKVEQCQSELCAPYQDVRPVSQSTHAGDQHQLVKVENTMLGSEPTDKDVMPDCDELKADGVLACGFSTTEFGSPLQETPLFRTIAATIPSPKFSESERHFLLRALGMESTSLTPSTNPSQPPACKRALLQSL